MVSLFWITHPPVHPSVHELSLPLIDASPQPTARLVESAYEVGKKQCLRVALAAETNSRLMVRFIVDQILDGARGDKLVLIRGRAFDKDMQELSSRCVRSGCGHAWKGS